MFASSSSSTTTSSNNPVALANAYTPQQYAEDHLREVFEFIKEKYEKEGRYLNPVGDVDAIRFTREEVLYVLEHKSVQLFEYMEIKTPAGQKWFYTEIIYSHSSQLAQFLRLFTPCQSPLPLSLYTKCDFFRREDKRINFDQFQSKIKTFSDLSADIRAIISQCDQSVYSIDISKRELLLIRNKALVLQNTRGIPKKNEEKSRETPPAITVTKDHSNSPASLLTQATSSNKPKSKRSFSRFFCCCSSVENDENHLGVPLIPTNSGK